MRPCSDVLHGRHAQVNELRPGALLLSDHGGDLVVVGLAGCQLGVLVVLNQLHNLHLLCLPGCNL